MRLRIRHALDQDDLTIGLAGLALAEGIGDRLAKALGDSAHTREPTRERYLVELAAEFSEAGRQLDRAVVRNVSRALRFFLPLGPARAVVKANRGPRRVLAKASRGPTLRSFPPGRRRGLLLSQDEIDELLDLIRAHYRVMIRAGGVISGAGISEAQIRRWRNLGIVRPNVQIDGLVADAFTAGRLEQILEDGQSLADMRRMAREFPLPREASLAMQAVQERVRWDLSGGMGYKAEEHAGQEIMAINARRVNEIAAAHRAGRLRHTPTNRTGLSPEEVAATETDAAVTDWRGLGREMRNRMARDDRARDWERVAASSTRLAANIGAIGGMLEQGVEFLYYDVHTNACDHCKRLYLDDQGQPRLFRVAELAATIEATGGANYGRKASRIGDPEQGWLPNALAHPWCQCRPKRVIRGVTPQARAAR